MQVRMVTPADLALVSAQPQGLFDNPVDPVQVVAFLESDLHHMAVAIADGTILSFASGTVLLHPDKAPSLFINEVGTRDGHQRRGHATAVSRCLIDHARGVGCVGAWLGTEPDNRAALALYRKLGGDERAIVGFGWDGVFGPG
ncbi:GNAT family N-acetyltransferase [Thalassococcus sp. CAU 1522]|uniref:GNAT family N-acetyltransferase n=1 Tax=Thalassococcus arenae TaxID=2851652 RepID=A0ABS6N7V2_9RHOB|nr:GNAT family N-acetyltransferase [Thalassococcus arenae]MBV2360094.1 GNAT family N-acetyltransferase [Thalassococcus arenae]